MKKQLLNEGARAGDLEYLVSKFISIDQYTTKIENDNIVISFFVKDKEPAHDLAEFISKNFFDTVIDIDVSANKTINGDYQVFLEMKRNQSFPVKFMKIIGTVTILTNEDKWIFKTAGYDKAIDLTKENLIKYIRLTPEKKTSDGTIEVVIYGKIHRYKKVQISKYTFEQQIAQSSDFNDAPSIEYNEIANQFPAYEVCMIDGTIYLIRDEKYYELVPQTTPLSD